MYVRNLKKFYLQISFVENSSIYVLVKMIIYRTKFGYKLDCNLKNKNITCVYIQNHT